MLIWVAYSHNSQIHSHMQLRLRFRYVRRHKPTVVTNTKSTEFYRILPNFKKSIKFANFHEF